MSTYEVKFATVSMGGEVRPCPFCGGQARMDYIDYSGDWFLRCGNHDCEVWPFIWRKDRQEAIDAWNRRAE